MVENSDKSSKPVANDQILNFAPEDNSKLASAALSNEAMTALKRLDAEIRDHKKQENEQSYLGSAFDFLYRKDEKSLKALEAMKLTAEDALKKGDLATVEGMTKNVNKQIEEDLRVRGWQKDINFYGSTGVKVGAVMFGGPIG